MPEFTGIPFPFFPSQLTVFVPANWNSSINLITSFPRRLYIFSVTVEASGKSYLIVVLGLKGFGLFWNNLNCSGIKFSSTLTTDAFIYEDLSSVSSVCPSDTFKYTE